MQNRNMKIGLMQQIAFLFLLGTMLIGVATVITLSAMTLKNVGKFKEVEADRLAAEVRLAVKEYPSYRWLLPYWVDHAQELDLVYDESFEYGTRTEEKLRLLHESGEDHLLRYADVQELEALPEDEQHLVAEVLYSWLITRINEIKTTNGVDYLFCVMTDESCKTQFFVFSAADPDSVRGTEYEQVYPLGVTVTVTEEQENAMRTALQSSSHFVEAGDYVDYYCPLERIDGREFLLGMSYRSSVILKDVGRQTQLTVANVMILHMIMMVVFLILVATYVLQPIRKLQKAIRSYKQDKNSAAVVKSLSKNPPPNEIGDLSEDVMALTREIDDYLAHISAINAEKKRIETELALAARIQADMLPNVYPPFPDRGEFDVFASMIPARSVAGDFYDYFLIDDDHLCLVMADVSGKGVPAALFMMASKIVLSNFAMAGKDPAEIFKDMNNAVCANNREEMFVTVWLGILEISTGKLTAANAGHEYPVIKLPGKPYTLYNDKHSFVIGGMPDVSYRSYELQLEPGSKLFLYTDGLPEAMDAQGAMFGVERMVEALNAHPDDTPQLLLKNVRKAVDGFVLEAEQFDDLTMLCLEYRGAKDETGGRES